VQNAYVHAFAQTHTHPHTHTQRKVLTLRLMLSRVCVCGGERERDGEAYVPSDMLSLTRRKCSNARMYAYAHTCTRPT
jgi:hypothetical protein